MNAASRRLGMTQSSWVNPNGLPADEQITSARDMAILARAILRELPEYEMYWHIPAIKFGRRVMRNTNGLIGRYPGADGMKTGFICASGFNVVASATRNGRKLIVVVFGSRSGAVRSEKAAQLFEKGFASGGLSWLMPSLGTVDALQPIAAAPPNLRDEMCGKNRKPPAAEEADDDETQQANSDVDPSSAFAMTLQSLRGAREDRADARTADAIMAGRRSHVGPARTARRRSTPQSPSSRRGKKQAAAATATAAAKDTAGSQDRREAEAARRRTCRPPATPPRRRNVRAGLRQDDAGRAAPAEEATPKRRQPKKAEADRRPPSPRSKPEAARSRRQATKQ